MVSIQLEALFLGPSKWGLPTGPSSCRPSQTGSMNNLQRTAICSILSLPNKIQALFTTHSQILKPLSSKTLSRSSMLEHDNQAICTSHTSSMRSDPYQNSSSLSIVTIPLALKHDGMQPWLLGCTFKRLSVLDKFERDTTSTTQPSTRSWGRLKPSSTNQPLIPENLQHKQHSTHSTTLVS